MKPPSRKNLAKNSSRSSARRRSNGSMAGKGSGMAGLWANRFASKRHCTGHTAAVSRSIGSGVLLFFHPVGNHPEQPAGLVEVEVRAMLHAKDPLAAPPLGAQLLGRMHDDSEKCLPANEFGDQFLRRTKIEGGAFHSVSPREAVSRNSDTARGRGVWPRWSPRLLCAVRF